MIDPKLQADVQGAEACRLYSYIDTKGKWSIGWGHEIFPQPASDPQLFWTQPQADTTLSTDLFSAQQFAQQTPEWLYLDTPCRQNAVIELCFNMRGKWMLFVNCRAAIRLQNWQEAHDQLLSSLWATEVHAARAGRLANYLLTGAYP